ncbi:uncharacterized protein [Rutidosis leptorrhynchoides]|uniref:uncharacterized protein n=1 Tax=Rutidosis leptorrhynchoides TaxID=125765 RepID=UPI003A98CEAB
MVNTLFNKFDIWDSDDEEDLDFLRAIAEELDADKADEAANNERVRQPRAYIHRDREEAGKTLHKHYFQDHPVYLDRQFRRRFKMSKDLFLRFDNDILSYDVEPLPSHFEIFKPKRDALGRLGFTTIQKATSALRQLVYGTTSDMFDEYLQMSEELYVDAYLRKPTSNNIARLYSAHEKKHDFKGMLESIACMHWNVAGANNDVNVLNKSSLFDDIKNGTAPIAPFTVNGHDYINGYYIVDGIYQDWATLMKAYSTPTDEPRAKFKQFQESARKDVERTISRKCT